MGTEKPLFILVPRGINKNRYLCVAPSPRSIFTFFRANSCKNILENVVKFLSIYVDESAH
jgi:hypothetical protein